MSYVIVSGICLVIGFVVGILVGRKNAPLVESAVAEGKAAGTFIKS